jgi:hypothetical protein
MLRVLLDKHLLKQREVVVALMDTIIVALYQQAELSVQVAVVQLMEVQVAELQTLLSTKLLGQAELFPNYLPSHQAHRVLRYT